jgi:hypothetical protein
MIGSFTRRTEKLADEREWLYVDAAGARLFHVGDVLEAGQMVGRGASGEAVRVSRNARVVGVEYDCEGDQLILTVAPRRARRTLDLLEALGHAG